MTEQKADLYTYPAHQMALDETSARIFDVAAGESDRQAMLAYCLGVIEAGAACLASFASEMDAAEYLNTLTGAILSRRDKELRGGMQ